MTETHPEMTSEDLVNLARRHLGKIRHSDPGIALIYDLDGLTQHAPNNDPDEGIELIKEAIVGAGMQAAEEGENAQLFTGNAISAVRALDAVFHLQWVHHNVAMPDVGRFFYVFPKGAQNVEFVPISCLGPLEDLQYVASFARKLTFLVVSDAT